MILHNEQAVRNLWTHPRSLAITCTQHFITHHQHCKHSNIVFSCFRRSQRQSPKMGPLGFGLWRDLLRGLCNLLIIECMNKIWYITSSLLQRVFYAFRVFGSQRQVQKMGPLGFGLWRDLLRGLCNLLIIECMNKFEHNIKFVTKSLTWRSVVLEFSEVPETGSKNGPSPSLLDLWSLRGLCNLLIIECMNKFEQITASLL